jgi:hypothetical protein
MLLRFFLLSNKSNGALWDQVRYMGTNNKGDIPLRDIEDSLEFELTFDGEMLDSKVFLPVVGERLVEGSILLLRDLARITCPDWFRLVELLVNLGLLLDLLLLLLLGLVLIFGILNLGLALFLLCLFLFLLFLLNLLRRMIRAD